MARNINNSILHKAKESKSDEFYTQYCDIESELLHYPNQFMGKTVYCNCDDPLKSNFFRFFIDNFHTLGLKKLISSCYKKPGNPTHESESPRGYYIVYNGEDYDNFEKISNIIHFQGDGDFRSAESKIFLKECDIVVTNPPFSLFREFVSTIMLYKKKFLIIGNINAITYKEIFELIQDNKIWLGHNLGRGISGFIVPDYYELYGTEARIDKDGQRIVSSNNCLWLTNLESPLRNEFIPLTKVYKGNESEYPTFDNYDAINVNRTQDIPMDFPGAMGVPITFLHKYNPRQFEIIKFRKGNDGKDLSIGGKCPYFRILIRNIQCQGNVSKEKTFHRSYMTESRTSKHSNHEAIQLSLF
ncbi:MAG: adenine-specific methyltransferase EcoRI family protein [Pseudoflavonifractor sp.]|nr:adenine-specific methyltransferase EcoRI family protein [Pseudoflavonifractor sp.]